MPFMKTEEEIAKEAAEEAREVTARLVREKGPLIEEALAALHGALAASEVKASYDKTGGQWLYSSPLPNHAVRLRAVQVALDLLDAWPARGAGAAPGSGRPDLSLPTSLKEMLDAMYRQD